MNQGALSFTLLKLFYSLLIQLHAILFSIRVTSSSVDPKFAACEPTTFGNGQTISYPFYILGEEELSCEQPGFSFNSGKNGSLILNITNTQYVVQEFFYNNHSIGESIPSFPSECTAPIQNLTVGEYNFHFAPKQRYLFLFYGCNLTSLPGVVQEHGIGCSAENKTSSVVPFYAENQNLGLAWETCTGGLVIARVEDGEGGIREALRKGFVLNWSASDCSTCSSSGGRCGFNTSPDTYAFGCYCPDSVHAAHCPPPPPAPGPQQSGEADHESSVIAVTGEAEPKYVVIAVTVSVALGVVVLILIIYYFRRRLWSNLCGLVKDKSKAHQAFEDFLRNHGPLAVRRYSYLEIRKMTNYFAEKLGQGGYGGVFKGKIKDERLVAVKVLKRSKGNGEEFINEVASISRTSHVNIVTLLGFCFEGSKRALVYEFMSNGSLEKFIYGTNPMTVDNQLDCETLYQIAIGVAQGLEYLHRGCNTRIFHFDIKPHNILLDENFCPKISDFGLAKICPRNESIVSMLAARGTPGFIAPEVFSRNFGVVSYKSDVYSFGMMVLEMVGGRKNINVEVDRTSEIYFPYWIYRRLEMNEELALSNITNDSDRDRIRKMVIVSLWCIQTDPSDRPTMATVVDMLEGRVETLQLPPKPFFSSPSRSTRHSSAN